MTSLSALVAANVAELLRERRLSVRHTARVLGMKHQTFADKLSGRTRFSLDDLGLIDERLHVRPAELMEQPAVLVDEPPAVAS